MGYHKNKYDYIYVAYLDGGRVYIGKSGDIQHRKWQHYHHEGSKVTKKYRPHYIRIEKIVPHRYGRLAEIQTEQKYERKFGKNKVRGGRREHAYNF